MGSGWATDETHVALACSFEGIQQSDPVASDGVRGWLDTEGSEFLRFAGARVIVGHNDQRKLYGKIW